MRDRIKYLQLSLFPEIVPDTPVLPILKYIKNGHNAITSRRASKLSNELQVKRRSKNNRKDDC